MKRVCFPLVRSCRQQQQIRCGFRQAPPQELIRQARELGLSLSESGSLSHALMVRHVTRSATVLAFQNLFMLLAMITLLGLGPALFLSKRGKAAELREGEQER